MNHPLWKIYSHVFQQRQQQEKIDSEVKFETPIIKDNKYKIAFDLRNFKPEEVELAFSHDNILEINAKQEKMNDDGSKLNYIYRQYKHHFTVPDDVQHDKLTSKLNSSGILWIKAPIKDEKATCDGTKNISIKFINKD